MTAHTVRLPCIACVADVVVPVEVALLVDQGRTVEFTCPAGHHVSWPVSPVDEWSALVGAGVLSDFPAPPTAVT